MSEQQEVDRKKGVEGINELQREQDPALRKESKRIKISWQNVTIAMLFAVIGIISVLFFKKEPKQQIAVNTSTAQLIPDAEITEEYMNSFVKTERVKKPLKKVEKAAPPPKLAPVGPMTIYVADHVGAGALGVPMGTELHAVIENSVIADDRAVPVVAKLTQNFVKGGELILPKESRLFGQTSGMVENRLHVHFKRIVFPDGSEHRFSGIALDQRGVGGIKGKVKGKRGSRALAVLGGAALGATGIFMPRGESYSDAFARESHRGAVGEMGRDMNYYRRTGATPVITIRAHTRITIMVDRSL